MVLHAWFGWLSQKWDLIHPLLCGQLASLLRTLCFNTRRRRSWWQHSPESGSYRPVSTFHMWLKPNMLRRRRRLSEAWLSLSSDFFSPPQKPRKLKAALGNSAESLMLHTFLNSSNIFCGDLDFLLRPRRKRPRCDGPAVVALLFLLLSTTLRGFIDDLFPTTLLLDLYVVR